MEEPLIKIKTPFQVELDVNNFFKLFYRNVNRSWRSLGYLMIN